MIHFVQNKVTDTEKNFLTHFIYIMLIVVVHYFVQKIIKTQEIVFLIIKNINIYHFNLL